MMDGPPTHGRQRGSLVRGDLARNTGRRFPALSRQNSTSTWQIICLGLRIDTTYSTPSSV